MTSTHTLPVGTEHEATHTALKMNDLTSTEPRLGLGLAHSGVFANLASVVEMATKAELLGFSSLWAMDRLMAPVSPRTPYPASADGVLPLEQHNVFDPIIALAIAATATERIRLGTNVLVAPFYSPIVLARSLAAIDIACNGRLIVGLGLGWSADEFDAVGVPQRHLAGHLEEFLDVLEAVWADGVSSHRGERFHIAPASILPKPIQRPRPPLLLAAYTPRGLERVARRADGWTPAGLPIEAISPMYGVVRDMAAEHGRDPDAVQLFVRANASVTDRPLGKDRPAYHGSTDQITQDLDATLSTGAHEIILELQGCAASVDELLELATVMTRPVFAAI
ncbi:MAG TPA: TIGR03619 family F420-dependent LLM class oxidoreductase [Ilumatobacter sp.]|nr:TIGR03619 family F420-dependent LLM class oxidoreductase [Ilumatobacter sp.]